MCNWASAHCLQAESLNPPPTWFLQGRPCTSIATARPPPGFYKVDHVRVLHLHGGGRPLLRLRHSDLHPLQHVRLETSKIAYCYLQSYGISIIFMLQGEKSYLSYPGLTSLRYL